MQAACNPSRHGPDWTEPSAGGPVTNRGCCSGRTGPDGGLSRARSARCRSAMPGRAGNAALRHCRPARQGRRRKPRTGAKRRCPQWACRCRPNASRSTCRPPICPRKDRITICRLRWHCSARWASPMRSNCGDWIVVGELALDGRIVASPGVLLAALHASEAEVGPDLSGQHKAQKRAGPAASDLLPRPIWSACSTI